MAEDLKKMYRTIMDDHFSPNMEISFVDGDNRQTLFYEKVAWVVDDVQKGLRYGENPGQEAALYKLVNGNLALGEAHTIQPGQYLASDMDLLQSGKHPGKTNVTDADNSLNILRYFKDRPAVVIVKHNNPCGVARADSLEEAYMKANMADRVAAFGGCIALNQPVDKATAEAISQQYAEVVVAPDFEAGVMDIFAKKPNLRVVRISNIGRLQTFVGERVVEFKSLIDGVSSLSGPLCLRPGQRKILSSPNATTGKDLSYQEGTNRAGVSRHALRLACGIGDHVQLGDICQGRNHRRHRNRRTGSRRCC